MNRVLLSAVCATVIVCSASSVAAQSDAESDARKNAVARQILDATHAPDQLLAAIEFGLPAMRQANPRIPAIFWDRFIEQARARRQEVLELLVPLYTRSFELSDLEALLQFYNSPLGRHLIEVQPALARDASQLGQAWGVRLGNEVAQQLQKEGVQPQP